MAQPAPALAITPSATIRIQNGVPNQDSVQIQIGQLVEIHNEDNTPYELPLSYLNGGSDDDYPLAVLLPAGGKVGLIGVSDATCEYGVGSVSAAESTDLPVGGPPYSIVVGSGKPDSRS
jgi:hypothetical protein